MAAATVEKIYDFKTIGVGSSISEVRKFNDELKKSVDLKKQLNELFAKGGDLSQLKKYQTELANVEKAEKARVVRMNTNMSHVIKLAKHNKELTMEIINLKDEIVNTTDALNEQNKAEVKAIQEAQAFYKTQQQVTKSTEQRTQKTRDLKKETLENKLIEQQRTAALKNQIREELNAKGSLEQRRAALIRLRGEYDKLSPKERDSSWGLRMQKTIQGLDTQVKALEGSTGRSQRNVGNYESAWGKFAQTGGKAFGVLRQIANILPGVGLSGVIMLGVEGIIALASAMDLVSHSTEEEIKQLELFNELQKEIATTIGKETATYVDLLDTAANVNLNYRDRGKAVDELISKFPDLFKNADREKILNGELSSSYDILATNIYKAAEAAAYKSRLDKLYTERASVQLKIDNLTKSNADGTFFYGRDDVNQLKAKISALDLEINRVRGLSQANKETFEDEAFYIDQNLKKKVEASKKEQEIQAKTGKAKDTENNKERTRIREEEQRQKEREAIDAINFKNKLNLMDEMAAEITKREKQYQDEIGSGANQKLAKESLEKDLLEIKIKYHQAYMQELEAQYNEETKRQNEIDEEKKRNALALSKNMDEIDQFREDQRMARYERELEQEKQQAEKLKKNQEVRKKAIEYFYQSSLDLAAQYFRNQSQLASQEADDRYQDVLKFQDGEKQKRLAQAQSAAEKEAIEREYDQKAQKAERQRNIERQEIARKQLYIEWAVASLKALSTSNNIYDGLAKEAIVTGEFLLALQSLNSQKFEEGGMPSAGGDITGPSHAAGGVPFSYEAEGGEMAIINKRSTMDKGMYNITGTPRQIASAINELGGGKRFAPGAIGTKFEYGGLLGANLSAPVMSAPAYSGSSDISGVQSQILKAIQSQGNQIRNIRVTLNPHDVRNFNSQYNKNVQLAVV